MDQHNNTLLSRKDLDAADAESAISTSQESERS